LQARETALEVWAAHVTDVRELDLIDAKWINEQPHLCITFVAQQIFHQTKADGTHIAGGPVRIQYNITHSLASVCLCYTHVHACYVRIE
jgi:hypothetical protein